MVSNFTSSLWNVNILVQHLILHNYVDCAALLQTCRFLQQNVQNMTLCTIDSSLDITWGAGFTHYYQRTMCHVTYPPENSVSCDLPTRERCVM